MTQIDFLVTKTSTGIKTTVYKKQHFVDFNLNRTTMLQLNIRPI